jgi:hypothetical protein
MLGLLALGYAGHSFEAAADSGAADTELLAGQLAVAIETAVAALRLDLGGAITP